MESGEIPESAETGSDLKRTGSNGQDLYALLESVILEQNAHRVPERPGPVAEKFWNEKAVHMIWDRYQIHLDKQNPRENDDFSEIHVQVFSSGKGGRDENFQLRKYSDGQVKAFWFFPEDIDSILLGETLAEEPVEIMLTPERTKRIGQVMLSAHAVSMIEAT